MRTTLIHVGNLILICTSIDKRICHPMKLSSIILGHFKYALLTLAWTRDKEHPQVRFVFIIVILNDRLTNSFVFLSVTWQKDSLAALCLKMLPKWWHQRRHQSPNFSYNRNVYIGLMVRIAAVTEIITTSAYTYAYIRGYPR